MKGYLVGCAFGLAVLQGIGAALPTACAQRDAGHHEDAVRPEPGPSGEAPASAAPDDLAAPDGGEAGNVGLAESPGRIPECVEAIPALCANPPPSGWVDCDGDGISAYVWCTEEFIFAPGWGDCDDADPSLHQLVVYDPDGDGHATHLEQRQLCVGDTIPERYALDPGLVEDCVEGDPGIHPDATDPWGDGLDFDCDELDPPSCANYPSEAPLEAPLSDACPDTSDVFVSTPIRWSCSSTVHYFFIGNRGHATFEGTMKVTATRGNAEPSDTPTTIIEGPLAPGKTTEVLTWHGGVDIVVELLDPDGTPLTDCDPANQLVGHDGESNCSCK